MKEIRIHGRGGQGAAVSSRILTAACLYEGKWACGFPLFGVERRGAPIAAFVRIDDSRIREKTKVYEPDALIILDPQLLDAKDVMQGLKKDSSLTVNQREPLKEQCHSSLKTVGTVDATGIALKEIGLSITNTCMLGAFARTTGWISLESLIKALEDYFIGKKLDRNVRAVKRGFEETIVKTF